MNKKFQGKIMKRTLHPALLSLLFSVAIAVILLLLSCVNSAAGQSLQPAPPEIHKFGDVIRVDNFVSLTLGNTRSLRIYLPDNYDATGDGYPVLYMHDGQNIFKPGGPYGCWFIEDVYDDLIKDGKMQKVIIVGIDNSDQRTEEYNQGKIWNVYGQESNCHVDKYAQFVIDEVMPWVNENYNTKTGPKNTAVAGSSYGGMASLYFAWNHSNVFGMVACYSSTLRWRSPERGTWHDTPLFEEIKNYTGPVKPVKLWIYSGDSEKLDLDNNGIDQYGEWSYELADTLVNHGWTFGEDLLFRTGYLCGHNEGSWRTYADQPFLFFWGNDDEYTVTGMTGRLSAYELDIDRCVPNTVVFATVSYANGLVADLPAALVTITSSKPGYYTESMGHVTLNTGVITPPDQLDLTFSYEGFSVDQTVVISQSLSETVSVTFDIVTPSGTTRPVYIVGDFSSWKFDNALQLNATDVSTDFVRYSDTFTFNRNQNITFKFSNSNSWSNEEVKSNLKPVDNRTWKCSGSSSTYYGTVSMWK
jgi:enterochelin esterase-like enzyme